MTRECGILKYLKHISGIRKLFGIAPASERQGFIGGPLSSGGWILPVAGIASVGVLRQQIGDVLQDIFGESLPYTKIFYLYR